MEFVHVDDEHRRAADGDLDGDGGRLDRVRDARGRHGDGVAAAGLFTDHVQRGLQPVRLDADHQRRIPAAEKTADAGDARDADLMLDQGADQGLGVLFLHDCEYELHGAGPPWMGCFHYSRRGGGRQPSAPGRARTGFAARIRAAAQ